MAGQRKALIIANDTYEQEALQDLLAPAADAEALRRVLGDPQIGDFAVEVVRNEASYVIEPRIEDLFSDSRPDDLLLLHFSGHGLKSESGELFFAASNTRPNRLGSTAVSADFVRRCMRDSRSRSVVLLLDCCYGGAFAQGVRVRATGDVHVMDSFPKERSGGRGRAVITASSAMEYAFEGDRLTDDRHPRPSVFTTALVDGLATGDADRDQDGWVSLNELYDYLFDKVRERSPHQTPSRQFELEGELYIARSRRGRSRPIPIPADLRAAMASPDMYARLGAVGELRSRLASEDLPVAVGAYEALAEIARTDIRYVADPAAAALREAAVQPAQTELHFGQAEEGSPSPHQIVQLLGPPIARACEPDPSDSWIRAEHVAEGLDISIDTNGTGSLHGNLALKGPTGEAVIAIDIDLVPPPPREHTPRDPSVTIDPGLISPLIHTDEPAGPPESPPQSPSRPASLSSPSDGLPSATDETSSHDIGQQTSPAWHLKVLGTETVPEDKAVQEDTSIPTETTHGGAPPGSRQGLHQTTTAGGPRRQSSAALIWAAGSAVLGIVLLAGASIPFISASSQKALWQAMLVAAVLGLLITGFERPFKQLGHFVHGWNFIWFLLLALFILKFHGTNIIDALDAFTALLAIGALGNGAFAAFSLFARGGSASSDMLLSVTSSLTTLGLAALALGNANGSRGLSQVGGVILLTASLATLLESVMVLAEKSRSRTDSDGVIAGPTLRRLSRGNGESLRSISLGLSRP